MLRHARATTPMAERKLLFALAGAGAGNASRVTAILESLDPRRFEIAVLAPNRARPDAFRHIARYPLLDVNYGDGEFTLWQILRRNGAFPVRYWMNRARVGRAMDEFRPDLLVVDSDFYSLPEARRRRIPILSVNSSSATLAMLRRMPRPPAACAFSYCIERIDRRLQRQADRVLCPVLGDVDTGDARTALLSPIVRRQFRRHAASGDLSAAFDVGVMLGGSGLGTSAIDLSRVRHSMVVIGATGGRYPPHAVRVPFTDEPAATLSRCRVLVIQGGFNSISEAIVLGKPAVIVPIPNHVEQLVNAWWADALGFGVMATGSDAGAAVERLLRADMPACAAARPRGDGATEAAAWIGEMAGA
jgi:UDP:flavonoid glycosyltransferase YjiC (YdhE family)